MLAIIYARVPGLGLVIYGPIVTCRVTIRGFRGVAILQLDLFLCAQKGK